MPKLHQILAVERDVKQTSDRRITDGYQMLQKPVLITGLTRVYNPKSEEGELSDQLPPESTRVQVRASEVMKTSMSEFERLWDIVATKDWANCDATANVVLPSGQVLLENAPATFLLWLEKQLTDIHTIVGKLPTLDPAFEWEWSDEFDCYVTPAIQTQRTKKIPRVLTKAAATDKHPAQVDVWQEDVIAGYWSTTHFSGALPATQARDMLDRVNEVREAVKVARSKANEIEITQQKVAAPVLNYIFTTNGAR